MTEGMLVYTVGATETASNGTKGVKISINEKGSPSKKFSVFIYEGKDKKLGTTDDKIIIYDPNGSLVSIDKNAFEYCLKKIKNGKTGSIETKTQKETSVDISPFNGKNVIDYNASLINLAQYDRLQLKELGFGDYEATFLSQYLPKIKDEAVKTLIKKGIVKAAAETDEAKRKQILNTIYSYARLVEQGDGGVSSATTIITTVQNKLNGFTSSRGKYEWGWGLGDSDVEVIEKTMQNELTSKNIGYFVTNFSFGGKPIHEAIYDECHDDYNVCKNTYTSIYYAIAARFNELGITNDNNPTAYQALVAAKAQIWAIEWSSDPIYGANDTECENARDALGTLINEFKKIENAHAGKSKTDKELELMNLIK